MYEREKELGKFMRRIAISFFYDEHGIVDEYMATLIKGIRPHVDHIIFVVNGALTVSSRQMMKPLVDEIIVRDNVGYDVWGYKEAIESIGYVELAEYDELLLFNHTFYGPIFPFSEMFDEMESRSCHFWGISAHRECPNPFTGEGRLPLHLNSHFIAVRKEMLTSEHFRNYWDNIQPINSYIDSILTHESKFTERFSKLGFSFSVYLDPEIYGSDYATFIDVDETIRNRSPILKRRPFFHDPQMGAAFSIDLPRALRIIRASSDYDTNLIWKNIARAGPLRTLNTNACLTSVLGDVTDIPGSALASVGKIAVCAHIYYVDMLPEILALAANIPVAFDFLATTDTREKKEAIEAAVNGRPGIGKTVVKVMEQNRGRDMAALFISMRDIFLSDQYDLVCRLHTKKSPQIGASLSNHFKHHMFDNLLNSRGYVSNLLNMFAANQAIGIAMPPIVHHGFPTMGHSWFGNKPKAEQIASELGLHVKFDEHTPIAVYGTMFWFRPKALRPLFERNWRYDEFNAEPNHFDGGLAHVLERLICYVAQDQGYITQQILCQDLAAYNYVWLEYKLADLCSSLYNGNFGYCSDVLRRWKDAGYPMHFNSPTIEPVSVEPPSVSATFKQFRRAIKRSVKKKIGRVVRRRN